MSLSSNDRRVCALSKDGSSACNNGPQLGTGPWRDVAAALGGACGVRHDGDLICDASADLGRPPRGKFREVQCHASRCCALLEMGGAACWGKDAAQAGWPHDKLHQLGMSGNATCALDSKGAAACWGRYEPKALGGDFESLFVGQVSACGIEAGGQAQCWFLSGNQRDTLPPVRAADVVLGYDAGCVLDHHGSLVCWDSSTFGPVPDGAFAELSGGKGAICGRRTDGRPQCWGSNTENMFGVPDEPLQTISAGDFSVCGLRQDGTIVCWGSGFGSAKQAPVGAFTSLAVGNSSCALDAQGHALCWPAASLDGNFVSLAAGSAYTCGLRVNGSVACTVGDPFFQKRSDPTPPSGIEFKSVHAGYEHLCGLDSAGHAHCWGRDVAGETNPPKDVGFSTLALGEKRSCGVSLEGSVHCWGGQPQQHTVDEGPYVDVAMTENTDLVDDAFVCAIRAADASVHCWGY